jgi:alkanesulfonate monooxygenase
MATTVPRFSWFLPSTGDAVNPGAAPPPGTVQSVEKLQGRREPTLDYLTSVAQAAEDGGFSALLTPVGLGCQDPWVLTSAIASRTRRIGFIVAFRPSLSSPTLVAQQADTFRKLFGERLLLNVVTGGDPTEQAAFGAATEHEHRYAVTDEALQVIRPLLRGERVSVDGAHVKVVDAALVRPRTDSPVPIFFGGASSTAVRVAARHADTYLMWGEPPEAIAERLATLRAAASQSGRSVRAGLRIHVLTRDTSRAAWAEAERLQRGFDPETVAQVAAKKARMDSVGESRMTDLHDFRHDTTVEDLVVAPNLWAGIGLVRDGAGTAIVGNHDEVADRLLEYADLGIDEFILSGYPHREEAARVGREVLPRVLRRAARAS